MTINGNDISKYTVYYGADASDKAKTGVAELVKYIELATGITLPTSTAKAGEYGIIVDETVVKVDGAFSNDDNFSIKSEGNSIRIKGSAERGVIYGCYDFLEQLVGWFFLTKNDDYIEPVDSVDISGVDYTESPGFAMRDNYGNIPNDKFRDYAWSTANGIHTFAALAPDYCQQYENQPCLLDEAVYEQMRTNLLKKIAEKPNSTLASVSMNDNTNWCTCEKCTAAFAAPGGKSEYVIKFVNRLADEVAKQYPNILIHTFAYADAVDAPITKPRDNVIVQFCPIQACIAHPLNDSCNKSSIAENIGTYIENWAKLDCKLYLWTYHGNFTNCPVPHTDISYKTMSENAKFYAECGAIGWFAQTNTAKAEELGDFGALRHYLISKFMWDPYITEEEFNNLVITFMKGTYGAGWEKIYEVYNTYIEKDTGHHMLFASVEDRRIVFTHKIDTEHLVDLFDEAELFAESELMWKNIDRNQLSFNMMEVFTKFDKMYKDDYDKSQLMAKWFQDKMLTYKVSYGSEHAMFVCLEIGQFDVNPGRWRQDLDDGYVRKFADVTVDYPAEPTELLPFAR